MSFDSPRSNEPFLAGGGELGQRMRHFDWAKTPLGPPVSWPQSLKTAVRIMLTSRQPIWVGWGKDLIYLYNDPYKSIIGGKHPDALGQPVRTVWREIWNDIAPMLNTAMTGDEGTYAEAQLLIMERNGYPEETYYTFSYSPIPSDTGGAGGIICANTDATRRVIGERQLALLRDLAAATTNARSWREACHRAADALCANPRDLPFSLIYILEPDGRSLSLAGACGIHSKHPAAPDSIPVADTSLWPLKEVLDSGALTLTNQLPPDLPTGAWQLTPSKAALLPIPAAGNTGRGGVLVVGLNPFRLFDDNYRNFLNLVAGHIAAAIANAQAYEEERKRAESLAELDRAKTTFFSNVSHEFRTPLALMLGPLQDTLNDSHGNLPREARDELAVVHRNALRLLKLVNTLLDFSRIEAGRVQAVYEPTDLAAFTADLASVFRSAVEKAGLRFTVDCPPLPEPVYIDRSMWEKIVLNLLSNAFKFTLKGEINLSLRASSKQVELSVHDTGSGIPEKELPRLFERFHRVEGTRGRTHEGTGIGLALVQELARLHGGTVSVESKIDDGSTFTVNLPLGRDHLPPDRINAAPAGAPTSIGADAFVEEARRWLPDAPAEPPRLFEEASVAGASAPDAERPRILLADDNADMRQYVHRLLAPLYDVHAVADGRQALDAVRKNPPSLLLTDVMMPNLDGFGLLKELRTRSDTFDLPVILLSARAGEEATLEGLQAGADDYLVKPFSARELLGRVAALLERKRFQKELAAANDRLRLALRAARMVAWEWDPASDTVTASDTAPAVYGFPDGETLISGNQGIALVHPDDAPRHRSIIQHAIDNLAPFHSQFRIIRPVDNKIAWLEERGAARKVESSGKVLVTGLAIDVSDAKRAELERERLLQSERNARNEAERASRLKEEFLATLSHELRTPLNAIMGWVQLLERSKLRDPEILEEAVDVIARNARAQTELIEDLLDMSRITTGKLRLNVQPVDLSDVINAAVESIRPAADAKSIRLSKILDTSRPVVSGDPSRLQQIVWNLLSNAVKFTPKQGRIQVLLERINSHVQISIADNGMGIPPDFLPFVFERFRQADATTTRKFGGLGLGLAIVKQLVELHGGSVRALSDGDAKGATFLVVLPLAVAHSSEAHIPAPGRAALPAADALSLAGVSVLVVDDEPDARHLVQRILENARARVFLASSADDALKLFQSQRPDVIVSDIGMPGQDGYEFMRTLRKLPPERGGQTPAAALTAYARPEDRRHALLAGFQTHIVKPTDPAELITVVASLAGKLSPSS